MTDAFNHKAKNFKEIKWIPVKDLSVIWVEAQRPLNEKHATMISDNFDPEMFGTLAVTLPNGHGIYHLIDGQHRKVAVEKLWGKNELVPCQVYDAQDPARAAELFGNINSGRRAPQPVELFKVRVTAKEEVQVEINRIVLKCGYSIGHRNKNTVHCVGALENVYQSYGPIVLEAVMRLIRRIWGEDQHAPVAPIVQGFGMFLSEFRTIEHVKLADALGKRYTPARFIGAARAAKEVNGGTTSMAIRDLTVQAYNTTVRGEKNKLVVNKKQVHKKK